MKKKLAVILGIVVVAIFVFHVQNSVVVEKNYKDTLYSISGKPVRLSDTGMNYFGNEARLDLNSDGREDIAFLATQSKKGGPVAYYVFAAFNTEKGYVGSAGMFLGEGIAPQSTVVDSRNFVVVNYADRKPNESIRTEPSVGKSMWLKFDLKTMQFGEVVQNFEGESNVQR
jgi:hypothetical protein